MSSGGVAGNTNINVGFCLASGDQPTTNGLWIQTQSGRLVFDLVIPCFPSSSSSATDSSPVKHHHFSGNGPLCYECTTGDIVGMGLLQSGRVIFSVNGQGGDCTRVLRAGSVGEACDCMLTGEKRSPADVAACCRNVDNVKLPFSFYLKNNINVLPWIQLESSGQRVRE